MTATYHPPLCGCRLCRRSWEDSPTDTPPPEELIREGIENWKAERRAARPTQEGSDG